MGFGSVFFTKVKEGWLEGWNGEEKRSYDPTPKTQTSAQQWSSLLTDMQRQGDSALRQAQDFHYAPSDSVRADIATDALARANDGMEAMSILISELQSENADLRGQLVVERRQTADLNQRLQDAKSGSFDAGTSTWAYVYLGLTPSLPEFAIKACRKAFRKACHPDLVRTPEAKAWNEEAFKASESAFDVIYQHKGF